MKILFILFLTNLFLSNSFAAQQKDQSMSATHAGKKRTSSDAQLSANSSNAKHQKIENKFNSLMQQYIPDGRGDIASYILDFLKSEKNKEEWTLAHELTLDSSLILEKALILNNGIMILAFSGGLLEIHENKEIYKLRIENPSKFEGLRKCLGNDEFYLEFHLNDRTHYDLIKSNIDPSLNIVDYTWQIHRSRFKLIPIHEMDPQLKPITHPIIRIDNEILNTNFETYPTTGFIQNGNKVRIYVLKSQKEILEKMFL